MLIDADWCWLALTDAYWFWLKLIPIDPDTDDSDSNDAYAYADGDIDVDADAADADAWTVISKISWDRDLHQIIFQDIFSFISCYCSRWERAIMF